MDIGDSINVGQAAGPVDKTGKPRLPVSFRLALGVILALALGGCASTSIDDKGRVVVHQLGYVKIVKPPVYPRDKAINVTGATLIGFSVGDGFTIGYKSNERIQVPLDCKILVVVNDTAQFEHLLDNLDSIAGDDLCATVSPE